MCPSLASLHAQMTASTEGHHFHGQVIHKLIFFILALAEAVHVTCKYHETDIDVDILPFFTNIKAFNCVTNLFLFELFESIP